jgi:putative ABC transport system permease protein
MFTIHRNLLAASTLAVGVAACTAIFSFVHPLLLNPFSYPRPTELVTIETRGPKGTQLPTTLADFQAWSPAVASIAAFDIGFFFLNNADEPEQIPGALVTTNLFHLLGVAPVRGRDFLPNEDRVVILTDAAWKRHFAADPNILGRSIALDFARTTDVERYTVIGVLPENFWMYYAGFEVFVPLDQKSAGNLNVIARLANIAQAQTILRAIPIEKDASPLVRNWQETSAQPVRPALLALAAASILLLLIASVNVTSLLLARANARRREIAIRTALGATPLHILKLLLAESLQLAAIAAAAGALLAKALVTILMKAIPPDLNSARLLPGLDRVSVDLPALGFAALIATAACIAAQILPAIELRNIDLVTGLKNAATTRAPRRILVTAEVALSVVLLSSAGLLLKTMAQIQNIDLGFQPKNLLVLRLPIPRGQSNPQARLEACYQAISSLPGVQSAALTSSQPLTGASGNRVVSPNYFATLGIPLKRGRIFTDADHHRTVINEALARRDYPTENPIGRTITFEGNHLEIVGIVADTHSRLFEKEGPIVYRSNKDAPASQIAIRTAADPLTLTKAVRNVVAQQGGTVAEINTMENFIKNDSWQHEQTATLTALFAALAFLLATVGLYGVISFAVARRRKEIGIRVALGARRPDVIALVLRESLIPVSIGLTIGLIGALALNQSLKNLFYEVAPADPQVLTAVAIAIALSTLAASYIPTRRALSIDPATTLGSL